MKDTWALESSNAAVFTVTECEDLREPVNSLLFDEPPWLCCTVKLSVTFVKIVPGFLALRVHSAVAVPPVSGMLGTVLIACSPADSSASPFRDSVAVALLMLYLLGLVTMNWTVNDELGGTD